MKLRLLLNLKLIGTFIFLCITCTLSMPIYASGTPLQQVDQVTAEQFILGPPLFIVANNSPSDFSVAAPAFVRLGRARQTANFIVNYNPSTCSEAVSAWSEEAQNAFDFAVSIWAGLIDSNQTIKIDACWRSDLENDILGSATTFLTANFPNTPVADTWYAIALANELSGEDLNDTESEIQANFNSNFSNWYFGTDGKMPRTDYDFSMVVLHELGHGLGFTGQMTVTKGQGGWGSFPAIYDRFTEDGESIALLTYLDNERLANALTGNANGVFFNGPNANMANSGHRVKLYTPNAWLEGSSYVHLDEIFNQTPHALMTFSQSPGESVHDPGAVTLCMLKDIGWNASCLLSSAFSVNDRYDVAKDHSLYVAPPGVLANDINANSNPRTYQLVQDDNGAHISELAWSDGQWHNQDITAIAIPTEPANTGTAPSPTSTALTTTSAKGEPRVYYIAHVAEAAHVIELAWQEQSRVWKWQDLTASIGATAGNIDAASPLASATVNGNPQVYYLGTDGHVYALVFNGTNWGFSDLTADASAPLASAGTLLATTITNDDPRVYYLTADGHIHELAWRSLTQVWSHGDLTALTKATPVAQQRLAVTTADLLPRVYYLGADQHVHELAWRGQYQWQDLTQTMNDDGIAVPLALVDSPLRATTVGSRGEPRVYFLSAGPKGYHVQELASVDDHWRYTDVTGSVAAASTVDPHTFAVAVAQFEPHLYYLGGDQHLHELAWSFDHWRDQDVTAVSGNLLTLSTTTAQAESLAVQVVNSVSHGTLRLNADGSFVYTPTMGFTGRDSFTYVATTDTARSSVTTVELDVTDECAPVDNNLIRNFCFGDGRVEWKFYHNDKSAKEGAFTISADNPYAGTASAMITIRAPGSNVQFYQTDLALLPKTTYELAFAAYANGGEDMRVFIHQHGVPYTNYGLRTNAVQLEPHWKYFTFTFTTPDLPEMNDARLRFWFAPYAQAGTVYHIDRVLLRKVSDIYGTSEPLVASAIDEDFERELLAGAEVPDESVTEPFQLFLPFIASE